MPRRNPVGLPFALVSVPIHIIVASALPPKACCFFTTLSRPHHRARSPLPHTTSPRARTVCEWHTPAARRPLSQPTHCHLRRRLGFALADRAEQPS